jgi:hypothetical protein
VDGGSTSSTVDLSLSTLIGAIQLSTTPLSRQDNGKNDTQMSRYRIMAKITAKIIGCSSSPGEAAKGRKINTAFDPIYPSIHPSPMILIRARQAE